jgi:hypothetical protein
MDTQKEIIVRLRKKMDTQMIILFFLHGSDTAEIIR